MKHSWQAKRRHAREIADATSSVRTMPLERVQRWATLFSSQASTRRAMLDEAERAAAQVRETMPSGPARRRELLDIGVEWLRAEHAHAVAMATIYIGEIAEREAAADA